MVGVLTVPLKGSENMFRSGYSLTDSHSIGKMLGGLLVKNGFLGSRWISVKKPIDAQMSYLYENWLSIRGLESAFPTTG